MRNGRTFPANEARIELAFIPILLLREKIPFLNKRGDLKYSELIDATQIEVDGLRVLPSLKISRLSRMLYIGHVPVKLTPLKFALYLIFARKRLHCKDICSGCENCGFSLKQIEDG
jgi:hypothetical protein